MEVYIQVVCSTEHHCSLTIPAMERTTIQSRLSWSSQSRIGGKRQTYGLVFDFQAVWINWLKSKAVCLATKFHCQEAAAKLSRRKSDETGRQSTGVGVIVLLTSCLAKLSTKSTDIVSPSRFSVFCSSIHQSEGGGAHGGKGDTPSCSC